MASAHVQVQGRGQRLGSVQDEVVAGGDLAGEVVWQAAVGEGDVVTLFQNDDLRVLVQASGPGCGAHPAGDPADDDDPGGFLGGGGLGHQRTSPPARCQAPIPPDRLAASNSSPRKCLAPVRERIPLAHITTTGRPLGRRLGALSMSPRATWMAPGTWPDFHSLFSRTSSRAAPRRTTSRACSALILAPRVPSAAPPLNNPRRRLSTDGLGVGVGGLVTVGSIRNSIPQGVYDRKVAV